MRCTSLHLMHLIHLSSKFLVLSKSFYPTLSYVANIACCHVPALGVPTNTQWFKNSCIKQKLLLYLAIYISLGDIKRIVNIDNIRKILILLFDTFFDDFITLHNVPERND